MKEKEGKRKSEDRGNGVGGRAVSRGVYKGGGRKQEERPQSSLFPVSLQWVRLIGWCGR